MKTKNVILILIAIAAVTIVILAVTNIFKGTQNEDREVLLRDVQDENSEYSNPDENTGQLLNENSNQTEVSEQQKNTEISEQQNNIEASLQNGNRAYSYNENDGIFVFYETEDEELYRKLLPEEFDMPENMIVHLFIMDFYDIDSDAEPYKEMSISLLAKYNNEEVWHCIYMPVTSEQSMIAGKIGLGLPKTIGDIQFLRDDLAYTGIITDDQNRTGTITLDTKGYNMSAYEETLIRNFMFLPKLNMLNGEIIQMTTSQGAVNIIDVAKRYPKYVTVQGGEAVILFDDADNTTLHPFDLEPSAMIAAYYLHNTIPFSLGRN